MLLQRPLGRPLMKSCKSKLSSRVLRTQETLDILDFLYVQSCMCEFCFMTCGDPPLDLKVWSLSCFFDIAHCLDSGHADTVRAPGVFCTAALGTKPWRFQDDPSPTSVPTSPRKKGIQFKNIKYNRSAYDIYIYICTYIHIQI